MGITACYYCHLKMLQKQDKMLKTLDSVQSKNNHRERENARDAARAPMKREKGKRLKGYIACCQQQQLQLQLKLSAEQIRSEICFFIMLFMLMYRFNQNDLLTAGLTF